MLPSTPSHLNSLCISSGWLVGWLLVLLLPVQCIPDRKNGRRPFPSHTAINSQKFLVCWCFSNWLSKACWGRLEEQGSDSNMQIYQCLSTSSSSLPPRRMEDDVSELSLYIRLHCPIYANIFTTTCLLRVPCIHTGLCLQMSTHANLATTWHGWVSALMW